ncbi:MAG: hypothetical protein Q9160_000623 [Pyrenula sp. 1 TL-2023]
MPSAASVTPDLPIPISRVTNRYLLFDITTVSWLRREHHVIGVLIGSMPQAPQQNVFMGLPLELMPEEVCLLVDKGVAYVVDDAKVHANGIRDLQKADRESYARALEQRGREYSKLFTSRKEESRDKAIRKKAVSNNTKSSESSTSVTDFAISTPQTFISSPKLSPLPGYSLSLTPTTSHPLISPTPPTFPPSSPAQDSASASLIPVPPSYPLYAHLHSKSYFMAPGLRFGCHYLVYPGDPLRFHSHFLGTGVGWDEELDLMDIVGGGRLGTGVKKGFLIGGEVVEEDGTREEGLERDKGDGQSRDKTKGTTGQVRCFSIEWAAM